MGSEADLSNTSTAQGQFPVRAASSSRQVSHRGEVIWDSVMRTTPDVQTLLDDCVERVGSSVLNKVRMRMVVRICLQADTAGIHKQLSRPNSQAAMEMTVTTGNNAGLHRAKSSQDFRF